MRPAGLDGGQQAPLPRRVRMPDRSTSRGGGGEDGLPVDGVAIA